ncbi:unnamed protein product [Musa acuminata subsp. malaccensis]|uniref:KAT8 regulatory NSL complex subunit 2 n=1 Tax=Musa acuminata subsp. malaccensis TaxID=214687 RepID=A0A804J5N0_MUSAM|nr:PREDICTED: INO80 complex subunit D-like [Musa acuminata subsp. malaccensis]CAG1838849.1 unnamed protein product [Musa acuminata subsp. malaccensis]
MGSAREAKVQRREESKPNPCPTRWAAVGTVEAPEAGPSAITVDGAGEDQCLRRSDALSREEVLRRRSRRVRQLARCYRRQYWALMEEVRVKHRNYYWEYGACPFEVDDGGGADERGRGADGNKENGRAGARDGEGGGGKGGERKRCAFAGCKSKVMPMTRFCHPHILADREQTLYKACSYVTKSCGQSGPVTCGKPVLRATVPSLCHVHSQKAQRSILQALKRAGLNLASSSRPAPKFSVLLAECVNQIQARRKELDAAVNDVDYIDEEVC